MRNTVFQLLALVFILNGSCLLSSYTPRNLLIYSCISTLMIYIGGILIGMTI